MALRALTRLFPFPKAAAVGPHSGDPLFAGVMPAFWRPPRHGNGGGEHHDGYGIGLP